MSPRKDPIHGVPVMTALEFFEEEGKRNGTDGATEMENFFTELDKDEQTWGEGLAQDMLHLVQAELKECPECHDNVPMPEKMVCVSVLDYAMKFKETMFEAWMIAEIQGELYFYIIDTWYYAGDFYEPPSEEWMIQWAKL